MRLANTTIALGIMLLLIAPLQACGRKGPLYLQQVPVTVAPASRVSPQSAPSPASPNPATQTSPNQTSTQPVQQP